MIDRESPVPPSQQIADILRTRILSGEIPAGRAIPSTIALEAEFGVARDTVRKAVRMLQAEGLVYTSVGMGIYVRDPGA